MNKIDLTTAKLKVISEDEMKVFYVSSLTGQGIELLEQELSQIHSFHEENITTVRVRHQQKLEKSCKIFTMQKCTLKIMSMTLLHRN